MPTRLRTERDARQGKECPMLVGKLSTDVGAWKVNMLIVDT